MDMLRWFGFRIVVISGDSTDSGRAMIKAMLSNCGELELMFIDNSQKYVSLVQKFGNLSAAVYVGDDIHDAEIGRHVAAFYSIESAPSTLHPYALSMPTVGPHTFIEICDVMLTKHFKLAPQFYAQYAQPRYTFVNLFKYKFYDTIIFVGSDDDVDEDADPEAIWLWFMSNVDNETRQYIENNLIRPGRLNVQYATTSSQFVDDSSTTLIVPLPSISFSNAYESFIEKILLRQAEVLILSNKLSETTAKQWTAVSIYAYIKYMLCRGNAAIPIDYYTYMLKLIHYLYVDANIIASMLNTAAAEEDIELRRAIIAILNATSYDVNAIDDECSRCKC
jgi:3-deoxy-D-manno-octulosonate 8-phosphate phosphatase KdsC-like HAD superfamily phosphatase